MSDQETESGPSLRDHLESAYASHSVSPDIETAVNGAVEHRDREARDQTRAKAGLDREGQASEARRKAVRDAVVEAKGKLAEQGGSRPAKPVKAGEAPIGPPPNWDQKAKGSWNDLPQEVRLAELRQHAELKPHFERLAEIDKVAAPHRERFQKYGLKSEAEAFGRLLEWENHLSNPATQKQAALNLMAQYNLNPHELAAMAGGAPQSHQAQPQVSPQDHEAATREITQFVRDASPSDGERETMAMLIAARPNRYVQGNSVNLRKALADARRIGGLEEAPAVRQAPPAARSSERRDTRRSSNSVRDSLQAAFAAARS